MFIEVDDSSIFIGDEHSCTNAYAIVRADALFLRSINVDPVCRKSGIGQQLISTLLEFASQKPFLTRIEGQFMPSPRDYENSARFFKNSGFNIEKRVDGEYIVRDI